MKRAIALLIVVCACPSTASALNPALEISQYAHFSWKIRDGFSKGAIRAIAQTPDGYLWLGTDYGLLRFDGIKALPWQPPADQQLPSKTIVSLFTTSDGTLWVGTDKGLVTVKDGRLRSYDQLAGSYIGKLVEDREGSVWATVATSRWKLCAIRNGGVQCYGEEGGPGADALGLYADRNGNLWVGTTTGLWHWLPGPPRFYPLPPEPNGIKGLSEDDDGALLISNAGGLRRLVQDKAEMAYPFPASMRNRHPSRVLRDRDGGFWVGGGGGLVHVHQGITDVFGQPDGLSGDDATVLFEDREGNIWVATRDGLDRFRDRAIAPLPVKQVVPNTPVEAVVASRDGSLWISRYDSVIQWTDGRMTVYGEPESPTNDRRSSNEVRHVSVSGLRGTHAMFQDGGGRIWLATLAASGHLENDRFVPLLGVSGGATRAIVEDSTAMWMANLTLGLLRVSAGTNEVDRVPWSTLSHKGSVNAVAADPSREGLWLGFLQGGVAHFSDGRLRESYSPANGLAAGRVSTLRLDRDGALWVSTDGGLSRAKDGRVATLTRKSGLPCDAVQWTILDDAGDSWLGMPCALVRVARPEMDAWITAVEKDSQKDRTVRTTVFDDGWRIFASPNFYGAPVVRSTDGRLWFISQDGVSVVDPRRLAINSRPPPMHVEDIIADHQTYDATSNGGRAIPLPALTRDVQIDYTALSLADPEKMRFRYLLEGYDREWHDVTRRQAFYQNLKPRTYRFRVIASNNSGVWNETGAFLDFSVDPAYYQTTWFLAATVGTALLLITGLYRLRVRQVAHQYNLRIEERVSERTRIARDLHDTLLQSFHAVVLQFRAATYLLPDRPEDARKTLDGVIDDASKAIVDARNAVQGLRASTDPTTTLVDAIAALAKELETGDSSPSKPQFTLHVEGTPGILQPLVRDDVYRIAREALRNAFRHSGATRIEVDVRYDRRQFRLRVRDDGKGIDDSLAAAGGRPGHYGLAGMRERAELVGGAFTLWSERGSGTEIELTIPSSTAYGK